MARAGSRFSAAACIGGVSVERGIGRDEVADYLKDPDVTVWVDLVDPGEPELALVVDEFGLDPFTLLDLGDNRPRAQVYPTYRFVRLGIARRGDGGAMSVDPVALFLGDRFVLSCHDGPAPELDRAFTSWANEHARADASSVSLLASIASAVVDTFTPVVAALELELHVSEAAIFETPGPDTLRRLLALRRELSGVRRHLDGLRRASAAFVVGSPASSSSWSRLAGVADEVSGLMGSVDSLREGAGSAVDAELALLSNELNVRMKTLTIVAVTAGAFSMVFDSFGMNVGGVPLRNQPAAYWLVIATVGSLCVTLIVLARRRRWL